MSIFKNLKITTSNILSSSNLKKIEKQMNIKLGKESKLIKCKNKIQLLEVDGKIIMFHHNNRWIFTLKYLRENDSIYPKVFVDTGAKEPIKRGCDVFVPGVYNYREMIQQKFDKDDIVIVEIVGYGIFAIAIALLSFEEVTADAKGNGFKILQVEQDELDTFN